jgi:uncharacterized phage protein (TIGR01671 family)
MNQIEFRAWNGHEMDYNPKFIGTGFINSIFDKNYYKETPPIFMQYTGFKDKRGVKIFDGDIVRDNILRSSIEGFKNNIGEIYQSKYGTCLWKRPRNEIHKIGGGEYIDSLLDDCEIIGNIYENPIYE